MSKPAVVAAIDFGTSNTKLAFGTETNDPNNPYKLATFTKWKCPPLGGLPYMTPTTILLDMDGEVVAYGWEAERKYRPPKQPGQKGDHLFKHFKMELHEEENFSMQRKIKPVNGDEKDSMLAIDIFSKALEYLQKMLMDFIKRTLGGLAIKSSDDILWVITVPAIWKPGARHFMREAAYKAGLCNKATRKQLLIALEPECAALYMRTQEEAKKCLTYAVVDCGGGTIDIAYHSLDEQEDDTYVLRELAPPSGGPHGGTLVDRAFEKLLEKIFGRPLNKSKDSETPFVDKLRARYTNVWMALMYDFETCKTMIQEDATEPIRFRLDLTFSHACMEITGKGYANLIEDCGVKGVTHTNAREMLIDAPVLADLFTKSIEGIQTCLCEGLTKIPEDFEVAALYMVGSFSLYHRLQDSIQDKVTGKKVDKNYVICPPDCGLAIVRGAVLYGFNPTLIQERISEYSYGLGIVIPFDETKHPRDRKLEVKSNEKCYCNGIYDEFLHCGEKIQNTRTLIKRTYNPTDPDQKSVNVSVYCAPTSVEYTDDKGCQELATIHVPMPDTTGGDSREVLVEIKFDGPEIHIVCTDKNSGEEIDESVEFHYKK